MAASEQEHWPGGPLGGGRHVISQKAKPHPRRRLLGLCVKVLEITRCSGALQPGMGEKKGSASSYSASRSKGGLDAGFLKFLILPVLFSLGLTINFYIFFLFSNSCLLN